MNRQDYSVDEFLLIANTRINNTIVDADIATRVATYGYTEERMLQGKAILDDAQAMVAVFNKEHGDVDDAFTLRNVAIDASKVLFNKHMAIANVALKGESAANVALQLRKTSARTLPSFMNQMHSFYTNLIKNTAWLDKMADYNVALEEIETTYAEVKKIVELHDNIFIEKGEAQQSTVARNTKLAELNDWLNDYESIAVLALADQPQLLEKIGIVVK